MPRNEHLTRVELIDPTLHELGWTGARIREEKTPGGSDIIDGRPVKRSGRTDYLLCLPILPGKPPLAVGVLEAKAEDKLPSLGIQQARRDAGKHHVPFVFSKLEIAQRLGFAAQQDIEPVASRVAEVGRMLNGLIEALQIDRAGY